MAYTIAYTDQANKGTITIEDNTLNTTTDLKIPGRNTTAYGTAIAENFLHLLENFASATQPSNPVEGQLWYDSTPGKEQLKVYNLPDWVPVGGIIRGTTEPEAANSQIGDLWTDTDNQQLYLFSGSGWVLVGPTFSDGLNTGPIPVSLTGTDNLVYNVVQIEVDAQPIAIIATDEFTPKTTIPGFTVIKPGVTLSSRDIKGDGAAKFYGTAEKAESLIVNNVNVSAGNFLRSDIVSTTLNGLNVQNNAGINYGINSEMNIGIEGNAGILQHQVAGSNIDLRVKNAGTSKTVVRVDSDLKVGINNEAPEEALDVTGNIQQSGVLKINDTTDATTIGTGSAIIKGGVGIAKNLFVGGQTELENTLNTRNIEPDQSNVRNIGAALNKYKTMYATTFIGNLTGNVSGTVSGRAGSADKLTSSTTFRLTGDVSADDFVFDGQVGGSVKTFTTSISNTIVSNKTSVTETQVDDEILINRTSGQTGLKKVSRRNLLKAVPTNPPGVIVPYAGIATPAGWLLCDGAEYLIAEYQALYDAILFSFKDSPESGKFAVPDLRGRFPLGLDNMNGVSANTVTNNSADTLGGIGGSETKTVTTKNLPEHEHDLRSPTGEQFYAVREINTGDTLLTGIQRSTVDIASQQNSQRILTSGGVLDGGDGDPLDVMNPYMSMKYIIYTGRSA
tara:strand:- start:31352 stop:33373 length:2022 start_codon:yes stop_codon:yes gene_type:complete